MIIASGGNVGIDTINPSYRLDVNGRIRAYAGASGISPRTDLGGTIIAEGSTRAGLYILTSGTAAGSYGSIWWGNGNLNTDAFITVANDTRAMAFGTADGTRLTIASTGAATFSSSVTAGGTLIANTGTGATFRTIFDSTNILEIGNYSAASGYQCLQIIGSPIKFYTGTAGSGSATLALTIATNQVATFSNIVSVNSGNALRLYNAANNDYSSISNSGSSGNATLLFGGSSGTMTLSSTGNLEISTGSIKTGEPDTGWGRAAIKIGARVSGTAFGVGGYLPVSVDGTVYYINLNSSTP
jgi:hypothetical protein